MKKAFQILLTVAIALFVALPAATAAQKYAVTNTMVVQTFKAGLDCEKCVTKVMKTLPYKKGIDDVKVDLKDRLITVKYDSSKSSDKTIIKELKKIDITAYVYNNNNPGSSQSNKTSNTSNKTSNKSSKR